MRKLLVLLAIITWGFVLFPPEAHAYIDPGSGSYIFQVIIAAVLGGGIAFRSEIKKIASTLKKYWTQNEDSKKEEGD